MTWHSILYNLLLSSCLIYTTGWGGGAHRFVAWFWLAANAASAYALSRSKAMFVHPELALLGVDLFTLVVLIFVALRVHHYWPMLAAGMQLGAIAVHVCKIIRPAMLPFGYALGSAIWSYFVLVAIMAGTRHRQLRRKLDVTRKS